MNDNLKTSDFLKAINKYADMQISAIEEETEAYRNDKIEQATKDSLEEAYHMIQDEIARKKSEIVTQTATKMRQMRIQLFALRQSITDSVFDEARKRIKNYTGTPQYKEKLSASAEKIAKLFSGEKCTVYISPNDTDYSEMISGIIPNAEIITDSSIKLGGIKAYCPASGVIADETLDSLLEAEKERFIATSGLKVV